MPDTLNAFTAGASSSPETDIDPGATLVFRPLDPPIESHHGVVWRKALPTKQTQVFLDKLAVVCEQLTNDDTDTHQA